MRVVLFGVCLLVAQGAWAEPREARVFVALCDNASQEIVPVGAKSGNGDDPDANLYWGCADGFGTYFKRSSHWKVVSEEKDVSPYILRRLKLRHVVEELTITAEAYRGSEIRRCLEDFEKAISAKQYALVAFIGHNGLMDFRLPAPNPVAENKTDVAVLCCLSEKYFEERIELMGARPVLLTRQFMYPGAFILDAIIEPWRKGEVLPKLRAAAGRAYAKNQKISERAGTGIFAELGK